MSERKSPWSLSFFPILLTYFIDNFGQAIIFPIFTSLLLQPQFHLLGSELPFFHKTALLLALTASFPLARIFGAPILGELSDQIGRKKVFIVTILGGIVGYLLTGWGIELQQLHLIWIGRIITGFFAGNLTLCLAAIADITYTREDRVRNFGIVGLIGSLGFVFAILVGVALSNSRLQDFFHPDIPFFLTAFLSAINLVLILFLFKESHITNPLRKINLIKGLLNISPAIHAKGISNIFAVYFLFILSWSTSLQFLSTYLIDTYHIPKPILPYIFLWMALIWCFANFVINPIAAKLFSSIKTFLICLLLLPLFLFLTLIPHQPLASFLTFFSFAAFFAALCWTTGLATLSLKTPKAVQGAVLGVNQSIGSVAFIIGPILGEIIVHVNFHQLYILTASLSLIAALLLLHHSLRTSQ